VKWITSTSRHDHEKDAAFSFRGAGRVAISTAFRPLRKLFEDFGSRVAPTYPKVEPTDPKVSMTPSYNGFTVASHASVPKPKHCSARSRTSQGPFDGAFLLHATFFRRK
jgi:hypothetical protein